MDYAAARHITIIPEIEIPGHSLAALAAYPELSCTGGPFQVATHFGIYKDIYCAGKETTFKFLEEILEEVMTLFPTSIIHIGGDEAPKTRWKRCPDCQQRMKEENIANEHDLQTWFTNRIAQHLEANHHQLMGWNQILGEGLNPSAIVQYWMGDEKKLIDAIRKDHRPGFQNISMACDPQRFSRVLLDQQDGRPALFDPHQGVHDVHDDHRGKPKGKLIQHEELGA